MKKSEKLKLKNFEFILVEKDDANISQIMSFCGISKNNIEEELNYHYGGDTFMITKNKNVDDLIGYYLIKSNEKIIVIDSKIFNYLFELIV